MTQAPFQFLSQACERAQDERWLARSNRWFQLACVMTGIGIFVFWTLLLLPDHSSLYLETLAGFGIFAAGIASGYGLKAHRDSSRP